METPALNRICHSFQDLTTDDSKLHKDVSALPEVQKLTIPILADVPMQSPSGVYIIAHSAEAQKKFDSIPLSWGVQYELARGVRNGSWKWEKVLHADLSELAGPNNKAAGVAHCLLRRPLADAPVDPSIWFVPRFRSLQFTR